MNIATTKFCPKCLKTKPLGKFHVCRSREDGRRAYCKTCTNAYSREWRKGRSDESKAKGNKTRAAWRHKNRAKLERKQADTRLQRIYGITLDEYDAMLEVQGGGCAICGKLPEEEGKRLTVDHNHESDAVRGLLCHQCNKALGLLQDSEELCLLAASYLHTKEVCQ